MKILHGVNDRGNLNKGWDHIQALIDAGHDCFSLDEEIEARRVALTAWQLPLTADQREALKISALTGRHPLELLLGIQSDRVRRVYADLERCPAERCHPNSILTRYRELISQNLRVFDTEQYIERMPRGGQRIWVRECPSTSAA